MASPGHRVRTDDRSRRASGLPHERVEIGLEFQRLHVVGIPPEAAVAPPDVRGIWSRAPETAQAGHVDVADSRAREIVGQPIAIELGIVAGAGEGNNVY